MGKRSASAESADVAQYIEPLHINRMTGRMLRLPATGKDKREILMLYGHHSSIERWWGLAQNLSEFGTVIMPDLPGFGGMDSFYSIGRQATLDNYADYLAAFIKMRYRRKRVSIMGISFGFLIVTRMLQRYPELAGRIDYLVSAMGFMHADNFKFSRPRYLFYRYASELVSMPPMPFIFRRTALTAPVLRAVYARTSNAKLKFEETKSDADLYEKTMRMEIDLWQSNDVRSYMRTTVELLCVNNCTIKIDLPVYHIYTQNDNYFENSIIEQQMRVVFSDFIPIQLHAKRHAPSVVADKKEAAAFVPPGLRRILRKKK